MSPAFFVAKNNNITNVKDILDIYQNDFDAQKDYRDTLDERERFILGELTDSVSPTRKSQVNDQTLLTSLIKRTNSVMAQIPTGTVRALSKKDRGKNILWNLILTKYIIPNAREQFPMYVKFWLMEFYSSIFGAQDILIDYVVGKDYVGPDFMLIPRRNGVPEAGKMSADDCEHYSVRTWVSKEFLKSKVADEKWNKANVEKLISQIKKGGKTADAENSSYVERNRMTEIENTQGTELITYYEKDKWTIVSKDFELTLNEKDNPFEDGELPIVSKLSIPLIDRYTGLPDYERMISIQKGQNSLINLYIDGHKMRVYPPLKAYLPDIVIKSFKYEPGAIWSVRNSNMNAIQEMQFSSQSDGAFQTAYQTLKGSLLSGTQTTDTSIPQSIDPGMGKTPQALKMQQSMDAVATNFNRKMLELSIEKIFDKMVNLLAKKQVKPIDLSLFDEDIKQLAKNYDDVKDMIEYDEFDSGSGGKVTIKPMEEKDTKYRFFIDTGSTMKKDEIAENATLTSMIELLLKVPGFPEQIAQSGSIRMGQDVFEFGEALKRWIITSGVEDAEKIVHEDENAGMMAEGQGMPMQDMTGQMAPQMPQQIGGMPGMPPGMAMGGAGVGPAQRMPMGSPQGMQMPMGEMEVPSMGQGGVTPEDQALIDDILSYNANGNTANTRGF